MTLSSALWRYKSTIIFLITPLVLLPLPLLVPGLEALCGYCMVLMGVYWMTEVIPLAVTAFIPLFLFPLLGIMGANDVSKAYFSDTNWLFIGGLIIAVGVESSNLHKRISLRVLTLVGSRPRSLMFGFMSTTFFLSMWISNTATTAMMIPIAEAVTNELTRNDASEESNTKEESRKKEGTSFLKRDTNPVESKCNANEEEIYSLEEFEKGTSFLRDNFDRETKEKADVYQIGSDEEDNKPETSNIQKGLAICVPYAASIGGTSTINGTGPNVVLVGQYQKFFPDATVKLSFSNWLIYALPSSILFFVICYVWLCVFYMDLRFADLARCFKRHKPTKKEKEAQRILEEEYKSLGSLSWSEGTVMVVFLSTALLWFFRDPGFITGWSSAFKDEYVDDGTVAMATSSLLFFLPAEKPEFLRRSGQSGASPVRAVLTWKEIQKFFPWNVVFLLGGGFALAQGAMESGLSGWLGDQLTVLGRIDTWLVCLIITIILCVFTEFTSNVATASIFIPILVALAQSIEVHPLYLLIPPILATSMAFMLPVATPPNAIAFAYGHLKVIDMVKAGSVLNIIGVAIVTIFINTYGIVFFGLDQFPDWAKADNSTTL